ncbi:MarR family transcriptional regulator [Amycolatopsis albidoflavus]
MLKRLHGRATWLVNLAQSRSHTLLSEAFAEAGSRPYHYRILAALEQAGPLSQAEAGRLSGIDRSDVTVALEALDQAGFTERQPHPSDGRKKLVRLTASGRRELARLDTVLEDVQTRFLAPLNASERQQFFTLVRKIADEGAPE